MVSVAARTITGAFAVKEGEGGCGVWEWGQRERGEAYVSLQMPPEGFCTLEVVVGVVEEEETAAATRMGGGEVPLASSFAH